MKCSRCEKDKPEIEFLRGGEIYKNCNKCNNERVARYQRHKEGIYSDKELMAVRRESAILRGNFICSRCGEEKPLDNFSPDKTGRSKYSKVGFCNHCRWLSQKFSKIKVSYGLSKEDFIEILQEQGGKCKVCNIDLEAFNQGDNKSNTLCIDHNHYTGAIRGFLCNNCNRAIGLFDDNKEVILSAYNYLVAHDKQGELLEKPEEVNQQPSLGSNTFEGSTTNDRVLTKDSNVNTSALPKVIERDSKGNPLTSISFKIIHFGDDIV